LLGKDEVELHRAATESIFIHSECTVRLRAGNPPTAIAKGLFDDAFRQPLELRQEDIGRLDEALAYYRTCPVDTNSARRVRLDILWFRNGVIALEETLVAETRDDTLPSSAKDFNALAMDTGVPRDKMEVIGGKPPEMDRVHPAEAPKKE
jgi:hypothetical protein